MKKIVLFLLSLVSLQSAYSQLSLPPSDTQGNRQHSYLPAQPGINQSPSAGNAWHSIGPFGGDIIDMAVSPTHPDMIFATGTQPYVSNDAGSSWTQLTALATLAAGPVNAIEATNGVIIATGINSPGKVFRSVNSGLTWQPCNYPVNTAGLCVATCQQNPNVMFAGLVSNLAATSNKVVIKSIDGGLMWTAFDMTDLLPVGNSVTDICMDPQNSQTIFLIGRSGFSDAKVVASFDGGTTWEDRTANLPFGKPYNKVAIAGHKVYVAGGQLFGGQNVGLYQSSDWGLSWTNVSTAFPNKVSNTVLINPADTNNIFVGTEGDGIYITTDGGLTWNYNTSGDGQNGAARTLLLRPGSSDVIYAGFLSSAVCKSTDSGLTWSFSSNGIATLNINDIEVDKSNPARLILGFEAENSGGCYISVDTGANWNLVNNLPGTRYSKVTIGADGILYAWSNGPSTVAQEGLYRSTDNGMSWHNMGPNIGNAFETEIWAIAASETNPNVLFIGGNNFGNNGWESTIYKTTNGGQTWDNVYEGTLPGNFESFKSLYIEPGTNDQIVYATYKSEVAGGILLSTNGGLSWSPISDGIPGPEKWFGSIISDTTGAGRLLAGCGGYGSNGRIYVSEDGGGSWTASSMNLGAYSKICDMVINPDHPDIVYAATTQNGAYLSVNGGMNWQAANDGIPAIQLSAFTRPFHSGSSVGLIASTLTNSAFRTTMVSPAAGMGEYDADVKVRLYPNPCKGLITIDLSSCPSTVEKVEILDACGKVVSRFQGRDIPAFGLLQAELPQGLFLCRIYSDRGCTTVKVSSVK